MICMCTYCLSLSGDTDLFTVNTVSGILKTLARLDRDVGPVCQFLSIQATDSAGENSLSNVTEVSAMQWQTATLAVQRCIVTL